jgi:hypothetical protein
LGYFVSSSSARTVRPGLGSGSGNEFDDRAETTQGLASPVGAQLIQQRSHHLLTFPKSFDVRNFYHAKSLSRPILFKESPNDNSYGATHLFLNDPFSMTASTDFDEGVPEKYENNCDPSRHSKLPIMVWFHPFNA